MDRKEFNSADYWELRYCRGRTSGNGSYGRLAVFKAEVINSFIEEHNIESVLDFGCGDGNQASFFNCQKYIGFDVSKTAIEQCRKKFKTDATKIFINTIEDLKPVDLTLSCEVLFHLVEPQVFYEYLVKLFEFANRFVIIYSSNNGRLPDAYHMKHRCFTNIVTKCFPFWKPLRRILNPYPEECFSDFYLYERIN